jgi:hypothetical protein
MKEYYVYEMHEVTSPTGKPYVGSSYRLKKRADQHKFNFKLDHKPELIIVDGPYYTRTEAKRAEQPYRIANGWKSENEISREGGKTSGKIAVKRGHIQALGKAQGSIQGLKNVESGRWENVRILGNQVNQERIICEHCGTECNRLNYGRWHGEKCKHRK